MKKSFIICLLAAVPAFAQDATVPSTEKLMRMLIQNQFTALDVDDAKKGCGIQSPMGKIRTLGDYLAHSSSSLIPDNGQAQVTSACKPSKGRPGQSCEVWFSTGGGTNSPWRYGVQFRIDSVGQLDPDSLRCPGAS